MENVDVIVALLFGVTFLGVLSKKFNFPLPIVLVLSGILISLIPGLPVIALQPDVIFFIFLPPLLYEAAWNTSWRDFKAAIRPISLAAIGLVFFTTLTVAWAAHALIEGLSWAEAFLLGAIVSPPDAVAATSVTKGLGLHPRLTAILEGESLVNDASGLIAYRYALFALTAGNFVLWKAGLNFLFVSVSGIAIGLITGYIIYLIHKKFFCDPVLEVTLSFVTPFAAYLISEHFEVSGVLAVVSCGLYLSYRSNETFSNESRIMAYAVWQAIIFILNALVFILIGLQLRNVIKGISSYPWQTLVISALIISFVVIIVRFIWVVPAALLPRVLSRRIREREQFDPRNMVIFGWAGMRGVVSMAAALGLPFVIAGDQRFVNRDLIIYLSFCVILVSLVVLGGTLKWVVRKMKVEPYSLVGEEYEVRNAVVTTAIGYIEDNLSLVQEDLLANIKSKYEVKYNRLQKTDLPSNYFGKGKTLAGNIFNEYTQLQIDLLKIERRAIQQMHRNGNASEEIIRKLERELDLEETRLKLEIYDSNYG